MKKTQEIETNNTYTPIYDDKGREVEISVRDLSVGFHTHGKKSHVIRNVSIDILKGETFAIVGESGSGKSVFTKTFTGMLEDNGFISKGNILFQGQDLVKFGNNNRLWKKIRGRKIATIFQDPMTSLNPLFRIGTQIKEVLKLHRGMTTKEAKAEAIEILRKVKIPDPEKRYYDYPFQYSGGMRQRVVIAIALACKPDVLICDEPTTALDVTVQTQIIELIKSLQKEYGFTTVFITHDLGVVAGVADRVAVMYGGEIVEYGTVEDIFYRPAHPYTWALLSSLPQLAEEGDSLTYIKGNPPTFSNEIEGDAFAPRNEYAMKIDFIKEPPMFKITDSHFAKTWLLDPRAPKVKKPKIIENLSKKIASSKVIVEEVNAKEGDSNEK